jgi:hypothetical protein
MVLVLPYELTDTAISEGVFDPDLRQQWSSLVQEILSLRRPQEPIRVTLSGEAADYFKSWLQSWLDKAHIDAEADEASIVGYGSAFGAKLRGMALRMILALHVARCSTPDAASPDLETVRAVLDHWVPFIRAHVSQVSSIIRDDPDHKLAERILRWLARHPDVADFSRARLLRALKDSGSGGAVSRSNDLNGALTYLVELGWLRARGHVSSGWRAAVPAAANYEVHPQLAAYLAEFDEADRQATAEGPA